MFALLGAGSFGLAVIDARLVQNPLDYQLYQPIVFRGGDRVSRIGALPVPGQKLLHQRVHLPEALNPGVARIPILVLEVVGEPRKGQQQAQAAVLLLGRGDLLEIAQNLDHLLDRVVHAAVRPSGDEVRLGLDAEQLHVLVPEDRVGELSHVEVRERLQRLDELEHVVPLTVEDQLAKKQDIVAVLAVYHPRLSLQRELRDVKVSAVEELQR